VLNRNEALRHELRAVRRAIYADPASTHWFTMIGSIHSRWYDIWREEECRFGSPLTVYLRNVQLSELSDICATHETPALPEPTPPTSHDLNYGQQMQQLFIILYTNFIKTGNMQGIPRPRHDSDWALTDGFESLDPLFFSPPSDEIAKDLPYTTYGVLKPKEEPEPELKRELPPAITGTGTGAKTYLPFGASLNRLTVLPDAKSVEDRKRVTELLAQQAAVR
jgi:hypothetical protein